MGRWEFRYFTDIDLYKCSVRAIYYTWLKGLNSKLGSRGQHKSWEEGVTNVLNPWNEWLYPFRSVLFNRKFIPLSTKAMQFQNNSTCPALYWKNCPTACQWCNPNWSPPNDSHLHSKLGISSPCIDLLTGKAGLAGWKLPEVQSNTFEAISTTTTTRGTNLGKVHRVSVLQWEI
jgi:hypothetical protein